MSKPIQKKKSRKQRPMMIDDACVLDYQPHRVGAALPWDHAPHGVRANWAKLSQDIGTRDTGRGIRSGF